MNASTSELSIAMPIGIAPDGTDVAAYYETLKQELAVAVVDDETVRIWTTDDDQYSSLFAMATGTLRFLPAGAQGPRGQPVSDATLVLKIWIWDYLKLRKFVAPGTPLPKLITYGKVDETQVRTAIQQEVESKQRYAKHTAAEKTALVDAFMTDGTRLLVAAGTPIGRGVLDSSSVAPLGAARRVDLEFVHRDGAIEMPNEVFEVWSVGLGPPVEGHPLLVRVKGAITPSISPLEGGLRVKIAGTNVATGTMAELDGVILADLKIAVDGSSLYGTLPAATAGKHSVVLRPPSGTDVPVGVITYVTDVITTARAVVAAHSVRLQEILDTIAELKAQGSLDDRARLQIDGWLSELQWVPSRQIVARAFDGGGSFRHPSVDSAWVRSATQLSALTEEIYASLGE